MYLLAVYLFYPMLVDEQFVQAVFHVLIYFHSKTNMHAFVYALFWIQEFWLSSSSLYFATDAVDAGACVNLWGLEEDKSSGRLIFNCYVRSIGVHVESWKGTCVNPSEL